MKMISIESLRHLYRLVELRARYVGKDESGNPIYNEGNVVLPTITFGGTVKLHGTNGSVEVKDNRIVSVNSKTSELSETSDNFGFFKWVQERKATFEKLYDGKYFGEFVGVGINKGDAITKMPKSFFVFFVENDGVITRPKFNSFEQELIFNICNFETYSVTIDFNLPLEKNLEIVNFYIKDFEQKCPVASEFDLTGPGEGIVFFTDDYSLGFKVKTLAHIEGSEKEIKVTKDIGQDLVNFIEQFVTIARVNKALATNLVYPNQMKEIIFWVLEDLKKEESDQIQRFGESNVLKAIPKQIKKVLQ